MADGNDPGLLAGVPVALKDNLCTRGVPTTCSSRILEGWRPPYDATVVTRLAPGRGGGGGQDQHGRVRHGVVHRDLGLRSHPQPARHRPGPGGLVGGVGRRRGRRLRPPGPRLGHRRLHPPAGRPVRGGGDEAHLRHGVPLRPGGLRQLPRPDRAVRHHGGRRRPALRRDRRPRPGRLHLAQPAHAPGALGARRRGGRADRGRADRAARRGRPRRGGPGTPGRRGLRRRPGPGWRRSRCPRWPSGSPPTT